MKTKTSKPLSIALVGGLTAGPIIPLLALRQEIKDKHPTARFLVIDVNHSVGEIMAKREHLPFYPIKAGKLRRYFSWRTIASPVQVFGGLIQSLQILRRHKVSHVIAAGGFVQVPVVWAAWLLRIPVHLHQQDVEPTLANKLCAPLAKTMSVTFEYSLLDFPQSSGLFSGSRKASIAWTGNPVRQEILQASKVEAQKFFELDRSWPTIFIIGGGRGAAGLNELVNQALPELIRTVQVIHSTGKGKMKPAAVLKEKQNHYHPFEFIARSELAFAASDIVVSRAGIGTITELANLGKPSIIIPMPGTHQETNAYLLYKAEAAIVLDQREVDAAGFVRIIRKMLFDLELQKQLGENIKTIMPQKSAKLISDLIGF